MIPDEAVEAAARVHQSFRQKGGYLAWDDLLEPGKTLRLKSMSAALEAAIPTLLSHEREETRLAHLDAMVNAASVSKYERAIDAIHALADKWDVDGWNADMPLNARAGAGYIRAAIAEALK